MPWDLATYAANQGGFEIESGSDDLNDSSTRSVTARIVADAADVKAAHRSGDRCYALAALPRRPTLRSADLT